MQMAFLTTLLIAVQVLAAIAIIILVLLQHGKGADMGAAFGSGASGSLFGATGSANFLSRATAAVSTLFFLSTIGLAYSATSTRTVKAPVGGVMTTMPVADPAKTAGKDAPADAKDAPKKDASSGDGSKAADIPK
jgi:preprotein translocase subunit SecG